MEPGIEQFMASFQALNRHLRLAAFDAGRQRQQPITKVQWLLLRQLHRRAGMTIGQLAEHLDVRASTMSQMLDRLERSGYVRREQDAQDARVKMINLTAAGSDVIAQTETVWMEALSEPFGQLSGEERDALVLLMKKLADCVPRRGEA